MDKLREVIEMMTKEMEQLRMSYQEQVKTTEAEREMHRDTVEKYNTLIDKLVGKDEEIERTMREKEKELHRNAETQTKLQQKDDEIVKLRHNDQEKVQEIETLKQNITKKQSDIEKLKDTVQANTEKHAAELQVLKKELKTNEDEIDKVKQRDLEKDKDIDKLKQTLAKNKLI